MAGGRDPCCIWHEAGTLHSIFSKVTQFSQNCSNFCCCVENYPNTSGHKAHALFWSCLSSWNLEVAHGELQSEAGWGARLSRSPCGWSLVLPVSWDLHGASTRGLSSTVVSGEKTLHLVPGHPQEPASQENRQSMTASDPAVNVLWFYLSVFCWSQAGHRDQSRFRAGDTDPPTSQWESVKVFAESFFFFFFNYSLKKKISHFQRCCVSPLS